MSSLLFIRLFIFQMSDRGIDNTKPQTSSKEHRVVEVEGLLNYVDWLMREATDGPSSSHPPQPQESDSNTDLFEQVEGEEDEDDVMEEINRYQSIECELPNETSPHPHQSSTNVGTSASDTTLYAVIGCHIFQLKGLNILPANSISP